MPILESTSLLSLFLFESFNHTSSPLSSPPPPPCLPQPTFLIFLILHDAARHGPASAAGGCMPHRAT